MSLAVSTNVTWRSMPETPSGPPSGRTRAASFSFSLPGVCRGHHDARPSDRLVDEQVAGDRGLEVLRLLTRSLSNVEIGQQLFLSEATVKTHVTRVLGKLGVRDRVQAVVLASESGPVQPGDREQGDVTDP